jgi:hypothetical protein
MAPRQLIIETFERRLAVISSLCVACWFLGFVFFLFPYTSPIRLCLYFGLILALLVAGSVSSGPKRDYDWRPWLVKVFALIALVGDAGFLLWMIQRGELDSLSDMEMLRLVLVHFVFYPSSYVALFWWHLQVAEYNEIRNEGEDEQTV